MSECKYCGAPQPFDTLSVDLMSSRYTKIAPEETHGVRSVDLDGREAWRGDGARVDMLWRGTEGEALAYAEELTKLHEAKGWRYYAARLPQDRLYTQDEYISKADAAIGARRG